MKDADDDGEDDDGPLFPLDEDHGPGLFGGEQEVVGGGADLADAFVAVLLLDQNVALTFCTLHKRKFWIDFRQRLSKNNEKKFRDSAFFSFPNFNLRFFWSSPYSFEEVAMRKCLLLLPSTMTLVTLILSALSSSLETLFSFPLIFTFSSG